MGAAPRFVAAQRGRIRAPRLRHSEWQFAFSSLSCVVSRSRQSRPPMRTSARRAAVTAARKRHGRAGWRSGPRSPPPSRSAPACRLFFRDHAPGSQPARIGAAAASAEEGLVTLSAEQIAAAQIDDGRGGARRADARIVAPAVVTRRSRPHRPRRREGRRHGRRIAQEARRPGREGRGRSPSSTAARSPTPRATISPPRSASICKRRCSSARRGSSTRRSPPSRAFSRRAAPMTEAKLRVDLARQKLAALDLSRGGDRRACRASRSASCGARRSARRSAGKVIERRVDLGQPVGGEGQEKELYVDRRSLDRVRRSCRADRRSAARCARGSACASRHGGEDDGRGPHRLRRPDARPRDPFRPRHRLFRQCGFRACVRARR